METEKILTYAAMGVAGVIALLFLIDLILGMPFGGYRVMDVLFVLGAAFVLWQGFETYRELK